MTQFGQVRVHDVDTPSLGDRSYLIEDGAVAVVIDPQRDIDRLVALAKALRVTITHVIETHIHNDYVSGGLALAAATGARYLVNAEDPVEFTRIGVLDRDIVEVSSSIQLRVVATPGHTHTHLSYVLEVDGQAVSVFTGGSLLNGSTGRPDLLGPQHTDTLAHAQWHSVRHLALEIADAARIFPTHGFGSFCAATATDSTAASTIGREKEVNPALRLAENDYVTTILSGLNSFPAYYAHMSAANLAGAQPWDQTPPRRANAAELRAIMDAGNFVVDIRNRKIFAAGYAAGTVNIGVDGSFASYLGWLMPAAAAATLRSHAPRVTLLGEGPEQIAVAQRELARIGFAQPLAQADGDPRSWTDQPLRTMSQATFADLAITLRHRPVFVIDVRQQSEWLASHLYGAVNIPLHRLADRLHELPALIGAARNVEIWVHCAAGYRASIAASILANAGHHIVAIDDEFHHAAAVGLPVEAGLDIRIEPRVAYV